MTIDWNPRPPQRQSASGGGCLRGLVTLLVSALIFGSAGYFARPTIDGWLKRSPASSIASSTQATPDITATSAAINFRDLSISSNSAAWSNDINGDETPEIVALASQNSAYDLVLLDGERGTVLWRTTTNTEFVSIVPVGEQILTLKDEQVKAYKTADGTLLWQAILSDRAEFAPAEVLQTPELVAIQSYDNQIAAFERISGKQRWQLQLPATYATELTRIGDDVCDQERDEKQSVDVLQCYGLVDGKKTRVLQLKKDWSDDVVWWVDEQDSQSIYRIYSEREPHVLEHFNTKTNSVDWSQALDSAFDPYSYSEIHVVQEQQRVAISFENTLVVASPQSVKQISEPEMRLVPFGIEDNVVYALAIKQRGTNTMNLVAFDIETGASLWKSATLGTWSDGRDLEKSWLFVPNFGILAGIQDAQETTNVSVRQINLDGSDGWTWNKTMFIGQKPQISRAANRLLVNDVDQIAVLDLKTGAVVWEVAR